MASSSHSIVTFSNFKLRICLFFCLIGITLAQLHDSTYYEKVCPKALLIIKAGVNLAVLRERRMGASLLRLHFHDCFVQGCDASVLLSDTPTFRGEQHAFPNDHSLRGFDVIENIKSALEFVCPNVVSCADILAVAARDSVVALGGLGWEVSLGRRDSTTASLSAANSDLPGPSLDLVDLIKAFKKKNFSVEEMVALSGAHTIGKARCQFFRSRIYNESNIDPSYAESLQANCPRKGGDDNFSPLDSSTMVDRFDNGYYNNLVNKKGLFHSDQQLFNGGPTDSLVKSYGMDPGLFQNDFAKAMEKMGQLGPLIYPNGQIRKQCSRVKY